MVVGPTARPLVDQESERIKAIVTVAFAMITAMAILKPIGLDCGAVRSVLVASAWASSNVSVGFQGVESIGVIQLLNNSPEPATAKMKKARCQACHSLRL